MGKTVVGQYIVAIFFGALLASVLFITQQWSGEPALSALNISLAATTLFLLGFVLLLGPLSRLFTIFDGLLKYRKELGIVSFFTGFLHVYLVMFPLARNGPWGLYISRPWSAYPGLEALIILFILFLFSWNYTMHLLGTKLWWQIQYWGARSAFLLIAFHMIVLKYKTILSWVIPGQSVTGMSGFHFPPLIIWEAQFVLFILVVRLSELFGKSAARHITQGISIVILTTMLWWMFLR
jgi:DMSO/TMAO reductase YedYZ heme-binding membrane subunit